MFIMAYRLKEHDPQKLCLQWNRQMPEPLGDWMIVSALDQGAADEPEYFEREDVWRAYEKHKHEICDTCRWFYDPSIESALVLSNYVVHHSYGRLGSLMMSPWFIKNLHLGSSPVVSEVPKWFDKIQNTSEIEIEIEIPMFVTTERNQGVSEWTRQNIEDERHYISNMGQPTHEIDIEAYDETLEVLAWAEEQLEGDGVRILCIYDP